MKEINYWEQFMATGKIEDFLAYKNVQRQEEREAMRAAEEDSDAGGHGAYRDGAKG
ncbi:MAG: hypothetical protein OSJ72_09265 [Lachnospiraceae bacterium]|nr:hypothetical protein [Lachnospiraceae bacterium]